MDDIATGAIVTGVLGGAMAAGGIGAAVRAAKMKAQPRKVYYGGSADAYNDISGGYADASQAGAGRADQGVAGYQAAQGTGAQLASRGFGLMDGAFARPASSAGVGTVAQLNPAAVAQAQAQQTIDANAQANLGAARAGGALAMRNAVAANAGAGVQAAQQAGVAGLQGRQQQLMQMAQLQQANADRDQAYQLQSLGLGGQLAAQGNAQGLQAVGGITQAGLAQQSLYQGALQSTQDQQFSADANYEARRQAEQQRRSNNIWNLAGSLIGGGTSLIGSAASMRGNSAPQPQVQQQQAPAG